MSLWTFAPQMSTMLLIAYICGSCFDVLSQCAAVHSISNKLWLKVARPSCYLCSALIRAMQQLLCFRTNSEIQFRSSFFSQNKKEKYASNHQWFILLTVTYLRVICQDYCLFIVAITKQYLKRKHIFLKLPSILYI